MLSQERFIRDLLEKFIVRRPIEDIPLGNAWFIIRTRVSAKPLKSQTNARAVNISGGDFETLL